MSDISSRIATLSPAKRQLLERRLAEEKPTNSPVAVVGMACRFPGASNLADYWRVISEGRILADVVPPERWPADTLYDPSPDQPGKLSSKWACLVDGIDQFDPGHFGITPREASRMDPQQRLLLETCWQAIEHAGIDPRALAKHPTGVYMGVGQCDYTRVMAQYDNSLFALDAHCGPGIALSISANRLSYVFDFNGPSLAIDTACSSALVAVHSAMASLRRGECDAALAGGVNVCLSPEFFISLSKARMLSPTGQCRPFDAAANGYVRGEGCGVVLLKRLADAERDGDRVLAIIRGSATNHGGRTSGITAPNGSAQQKVIRDALKDAGVEPRNIGYVEAHGTGTPLGDPIEVDSLSQIFRREERDDPVYLTSVKANIGHTEIAAGVAGLIKAVLVMQRGHIPPQAGLVDMNPYMKMDGSRIEIPRESVAWQSNESKFAGVSSFGFGGTNSHVVLECPAPAQLPKEASKAPPATISATTITNSNGSGGSEPSSNGYPAASASEKLRSPLLLTLSARTSSALPRLAAKYRDALGELPEARLTDFCYTANTGRSHFDQRAVVIGSSREELLDGLDALAEGRRSPSVRQGKRRLVNRMRVAGLFTGQGSQYAGMGKQLYAQQPAFRTALDRCDQLIDQLRGRSLLDVLEDADALNQTEWTQPALFAVEYSLAELWRAWGIKFDALIGHSVGEYVAACVAGVFDLETAVRLICRRGELMQALPAGGSMAVLFAGASDIEPHIERFADKVSIAAVNGPANTTLAGEAKLLERIIDGFEKAGVKAQRLEVSHAFHSPLMEPMLDEFEAFASQFEFAQPKVPIASNVTGKLESDAVFTPAYWRDHIRSAVQFAPGVADLREQKAEALLEMGPSPTLLGMARRAEPDWQPATATTLKKGTDEVLQASSALGDLYVAGVKLNLSAATGGKRAEQDYKPQRCEIPGYPLERESYWFVPNNATTRFRDHVYGASQVTPMLGSRVPDPQGVLFRNEVSSYLPNHTSDHVVREDVVLPGAAYIDMFLAAGREVFAGEAIAVESLSFPRAMFLSRGPRIVQTRVSGESETRQKVEIHSRAVDAEEGTPWDLNAKCSIVVRESPQVAAIEADEVIARHKVKLDQQAFYEVVAARGLDYGPAYQVIGAMYRCEDDVYCDLEPSEQAEHDAHHYMLHPAIGDGCMQAMVGAVPLEEDGSFCPDLYLPVSVRRVSVLGELERAAGYYVRRTSTDTDPRPDRVVGDVSVVDAEGNALVHLEGVEVQHVQSASDEPQDSAAHQLYQRRWVSKPTDSEEAGREEAGELPPSNYPPDNYVVVGSNEFAQQLQSRLNVAGSSESDTKLLGSESELGTYLAEVSAATAGKQSLTVVLTQPLEAPLPSEAEAGGGLDASTTIWTETFAALKQCLVPQYAGTMRVWVLTKGARHVQDGDAVNPNQSPIIGLTQVASQELRQRNVRSVDFDPAKTDDDCLTDLLTELTVTDSEPAVAYRGGERLVPRLAATPNALENDGLRYSQQVPTDSAYRLLLGERDTIDALRFEKTRRRVPGPGEVEVEIRAAGLNFSDVLKAIGIYPGINDDVVPLGLECSGVVAAVGPNVTRFKVGDPVMGVVPHAFASHCITSEHGLVGKPQTLSDEQAAAIPLAYLTAYYCLVTVARLQPGEKVLIHAGAGGVGQAAIEIAQHIGAEIFSTAGSDEKREFLRSRGVQHVMDSRTLAFADQIAEITGGEGVDVVLNSLPDDAIDASLRSLAAYGRFVEIGKVDIYANRPMGLAPFQDNLTYSAVDLDRLFRQRPQIASDLMVTLMEHFERGDYKPGPHTTFAIEDVRGAFRYMSQRRNIGKVVVTIDPPTETQVASGDQSDASGESQAVRPDGAYLITGGLGSLGMATAQMLAERGAGAVLLMSRRPPDEAADKQIAELTAAGTRVEVVNANVSDYESLKSALTQLPENLPPIRGVLHAAGVLRDGLINQMSQDDFQFPLPPKTHGTWNLHQLAEQLQWPLDFMVLYSSVSAVLGTGGQANYGAANAYLDGFARYRNALGKRTIAINWGAFAGGGMAEELADTMRSQGVELLPVEESLNLLPAAAASDQAELTVFRADWNRFGNLLRSMMSGDLQYTLLENLTSASGEEAAGESEQFITQLRAMNADRQRAELQQFFAEQMAQIMGTEPQDIDVDAPLTALGMDSLMAIELGGKMKALLKIELPMSVYLEGPSVESLADYVCGVLQESPQSADGAAADSGNATSDSAQSASS